MEKNSTESKLKELKVTLKLMIKENLKRSLKLAFMHLINNNKRKHITL